MKKKQIFLKTIVAITLLSAMLVSAFLGTSNAEYFKSLNKTLSLEMKPDLNLSYYLKHSPDRNTTLEEKRGTYKTSSGFTQLIGTPTISRFNNYKANPYMSQEVIYQVRIPVDETGYYTLDFTTYTLYGTPSEYDQYKSMAVYTVNPTLAFGCEVLTATDLLNNVSGNTTYDTFASGEKWSMPYRIFDIDTNERKYNKNDDKNYTQLLYSDTSIKEGGTGDSIYQWKSLCPSRVETVKLTFKVTDDDVEKGYVIWAWDLTGLEGGYNHTLHVENLSINKTMNLDGTTATRDSNDPYFMFPQTALSNGSFYQDDKADTVVGYTHYSNGRGTYVTEATDNSLGLRAEILHDEVNGSDADKRQNPLSLYIPLKNIEYDKTYKVTFDFSVAKQGSNAVDLGQYHKYNYSTGSSDWANYQDARYILRDDNHTSGLAGGGRACWSYLFSYNNKNDILYRHSYAGHSDLMSRLQYANKAYQGEPLTKYDEVTKIIASNYAHKEGWSTSTSVNDTYSKNIIEQNTGAGRYKSESRNWFNAVEHTEYNGQNQINWLTFYNTTFSFNIDSSKNNDVDLDNLYWIWMIDFLKYTAFYNIRIDNVRIQEVVEYSSSLDRNGVLFSESQKFTTLYANSFDQETDNVIEAQKTDSTKWKKGVFVSFRGINGTGQNYQSKGAVLDEVVGENKVFTCEGNIYAPIIDAKEITAAQEGEHAYQIALSGYAVCEGGIDRYVFSVDGGKTWHDMTLNGIDTDARKATDSNLTTAERGINQFVSGQTRYNTTEHPMTDAQREQFTHIDFTEADATNGNFQGVDQGKDDDPDPDIGWSLVADLSKFKHQANLDIIIAAVPESNHDLRCEILRIINYNQIRNYRTYVDDIISDISVESKNGTTSSLLNAHQGTGGTGGSTKENEDTFNTMKGWETYYTTTTSSGGPNSASSGYARRVSYSYDYEDIRTLYSDIPVKTKLAVGGWAMVEGGVDSYWWSVDSGKTWTECKGTPRTVTQQVLQKADSDYVAQYRSWYNNDKTGVPPADTATKITFQATGPEGNTFNENWIHADLSAYEGEIVDIIFCAKPIGSDVYVPVARIDNVAVYGEQGTFYTRVHRVIIDGRTNEDLSGDKNITVPTQTFKDSSGTKLNYQDKWNLGYSDQAYVIFEPQNVNAANSRYLFNDVKEIESAGRVTIDGYFMCKGGVSRYKFSLDGGDTWTCINDFGTNILADADKNGTVTPKYEMFNYCRASDSGFNLAIDGKNGNFCCTGMDKEGATTYNPTTATDANRKAFYDHALEFNIPALPKDAERDLLVVAESTKGKEFPVLHMKIRVKNTQYGYQNIANKAKFSTIQAGYTTSDRSWTFDPAFSDVLGENNKTLNRITIPVTETGEHTITFNHTISNPAVTREGTKRQLYDKEGNVQSGRYTDFTLSVPKTHFAYKEKIGVNFTCGFNSATADKTEYGTIKLAIISNDWKNHNGEQHAIRSQVFEPEFDDDGKYSVSVGDIRALSYENAGLTASSKGFKAGSYSILLLHIAPGELSNILITQKSRDAFILAEIPIYIHEEGVEFSVVHDEGKYTYFSDVSRQLTGGDDNVYTIATLSAAHLFDTPGTVAKKISGTVNVTEGDVRRGYIVLDTNYTGLWAGNKHTKTQCEAEYGDKNFGKNNLHASKHANDLCLSRDPDNGSRFTRILPGEKLREIFSNGEVVSTMKHPGITYTVNISLGEDAFTKT